MGRIRDASKCVGLLTERQRTAVTWTSLGLTNKGVARQMGCSYYAVCRLLRDAYATLGLQYQDDPSTCAALALYIASRVARTGDSQEEP